MKRAFLRLVLPAIALVGVAARAEQHPTRPPGEADLWPGAPSLERSALIAAVLDRNPSVEAARQAWIAAAAAVPQAGRLDDPMVSYSIAPLSIASSEADFGAVATFTQSLPYRGTLRLRREVAEATAAAAAERIDEARQRLAAMASFLFDDYWLVERALSITQEHIELVESFQRVAASRYATGMASLQAPIQAEVEAAHLLHRQVVLRTERRRLVARLNALLHRPAGASLPPPPERLDVDPPVAEGDEGGAPSRPEVAAGRAEVDALRARVALERLRLKPDFEVMASYNSMWDMEPHRWMVGAGLRLPVRRQRLHAAIAEADARLAAAESELAALSDSVAAEVEEALAAAEEAGHVVRLYRNRVLPAARDQVAAARAGFETGDGSMLDLIDAERSLLAAELSHEEAVADVATARTALDRALGRMPAAPDTTSPRASRADSAVGDQP